MTTAAEERVIQSFRDRATKLYGPVTSESNIAEHIERVGAELQEAETVSIRWNPEWDHWAVRIEDYFGDARREGEGRTLTQALEAVLQ